MTAALDLYRAERANPVRMAPPVRCLREGPVVQVAYTDFARVRCRFHTFFGPPPLAVARRILEEVGLEPRQLRVKVRQLGDLAVLRRMPADAAPELRPGAVMPIAFVDGLSESELAAALAALAAAFR